MKFNTIKNYYLVAQMPTQIVSLHNMTQKNDLTSQIGRKRIFESSSVFRVPLQKRVHFSFWLACVDANQSREYKCSLFTEEISHVCNGTIICYLPFLELQKR